VTVVDDDMAYIADLEHDPYIAHQPSPEHSLHPDRGWAYRAAMDRCYLLEQVVDAARYVEMQRKTGNVALTSTVAEPEPRRSAHTDGDPAAGPA
jgi:hypothetical protein